MTDWIVATWLTLSVLQAHGDAEAAKDLSDNLRSATQAMYVLSAPDAVTAAAQYGMVQANRGLVHNLKVSTNRERPDKSNNLSFPSGHTSTTTLQAIYAGRNNEDLKWIGMAMAGATAWARVEAKRHYWSDVIAGAAVAWGVSQWEYERSWGYVIPEVDLDYVGVRMVWKL